jgi:hypothetical protein
MGGKGRKGTSGERLKAKGWERQNTIDEPRLSELVKMYEDLGFEVHLEPLHRDELGECDQCMKAEPGRYKTIYIRPRKECKVRPKTAGGGLDDMY